MTLDAASGGDAGAAGPAGPRTPRRVVVVGAGITGLTLAHRLLHGAGGQGALDVVLLEASVRPGGKLMPIDVAGLPVEGGADSFVARKPWAVDLCRELGLEEELIRPGASGAFVWARGRLVPYPEHAAFAVPSDAESLLRWPGLSWRGRLRAVTDLYRKPARQDTDESLGDLVARRLGRECADVLVGPILAGVHAGDPDRLSVRATFPELRSWEVEHGSLIRGSGAARRAAREKGGGPLFFSLKGGLGRLTGRLIETVGPQRLRLGVAATGVRRAPGGRGWEVEAGGERLRADAVVLATPAFESARLLRAANIPGADALAAIPYVSTAAVALVYQEGTASRLPDATGFVVPGRGPASGEAEHEPHLSPVITACTWVSRKWPVPAFGDRAVVRAFVGHAGDRRPLALSEEELVGAVVRDVEAMSPVGAEPESWALVRWDRAMPQYELGHLDRLAATESALASHAPGMFVTGSAYRGVGVADCVRQAGEAADRVRRYLEAVSAPAARSGTDGGGGTDDRTEAISWTT